LKKPNVSSSSLPLGSKLSPHNGQLVISSGVPSLDDILGGGVPVGTLLTIKNDENTEYSSILAKYFLSQGVMSSQDICVCSLGKEPESFFKELFGVNDRSEKFGDMKSADEKMKIAWRYQNLSTVSSIIPRDETVNSFSHSFDLMKTMPDSKLEGVKKYTVTSASDEEKSDYEHVMSSLTQQVESYYTSLKTMPPNQPRTILRILIHDFGSPEWKFKDSNEPYQFLHALRGLLRFSFASCLITFADHLYTQNDLLTPNFQRLDFLSDYVVKLESFAGHSIENEHITSEYHGLFHLEKCSPINSLVPSSAKVSFLMGGQSTWNNLGFKLRRRKFSIEPFYLPPEGGVSERRVQPLPGGMNKPDPMDF